MTLLGFLLSAPASADAIAKIKAVTDVEHHDVRSYPTSLAQLLKGPLPSPQALNVDRNMDIQKGDSVLTGRANTHVRMNEDDRQAFLFSDTLVTFDTLNIWAIERGAMYVVNPRGRLEILKRKLATILANSSFYISVTERGILLYVLEGLVTVQTSAASVQLSAAQAARVSAAGTVQPTALSAAEESRIMSDIRAARQLLGAGGPGLGSIALGATVAAAGAGAHLGRDRLDHGPNYEEHVAPRADLAVTTATSPSGPAVINVPFSFLVQVTNNGPQTASDVNLADSIPGPFTIENVTSSEATCTPSSAMVECTRATLPAGSSFNVTIRVVSARAVSSVTNTVSVKANENDPNESNNLSSVPVSVGLPQADLSVGQTVSLDGPAFVGIPFSLLVQVSNTGPQAASNVILNTTIPYPLTIQGAASSTGTCAPFGATVRCTVSTLPAGSSFSVSIVVVAATSVPSVTAGSTVNASEPDPNQGNNFSSVRIVVQAPKQEADIVVSQTAQAIAPGKYPRWRITAKVQNRGPTVSVPDIDLDLAINATASQTWYLVPDSVAPSSLMRDCSAGRAQPGSLLGCNAGLDPFQEALVSFDIESCCTFTSNARTLACESEDPNCPNNSNSLVVTVKGAHDTAPAPPQEGPSKPPTLTLTSFLISSLSVPAADRARGTIAVDGQYVGAVENTGARKLPLVGRPGENRVESWLTASPQRPLVWEFSFEGAPGFVPGKLRVESGELVLLADRVIAFRVTSADQKVRFLFSLAE